MLRALVSVLFGCAVADVARMSQRIRDTEMFAILLKLKILLLFYNHFNIFCILNATNDRAFTGAVENALEDLVSNHGGYGCWCYFYDDVGRGKGTPVDEIDSFCKTLNEGYECAIRDSEDEGLSCIPWEVDYLPGLGVGQNLYKSCKELNSDDMCKTRACAIEGHFTNNLVAILLSGNFMDYASFGHFDGFDASHDGGCPVKSGIKGVSASKNCCGAYPLRFPYKNLDGERACCGTRTYNTQLLNCCENGQVKANC